MARALLVVAVAVASALAQTTHVVGIGGAFAQIRAALAVAAPGDVILVLPGTYAQFDATVGVTIRAVPGTVTIAYDPAFAPPNCSSTPACAAAEGPTRFLLPAGQTAHVVGLSFERWLGLAMGVPKVVVSGGRVTFDHCVFESFAQEALRVDAATVHLQYCTATGVNPFVESHALGGANSVVTVVGGSFTGSSPAPPWGPFTGNGGDGIRLVACSFHGSGFHAQGGSAPAPHSGGLGVRLVGGVGWVSDAVIHGGNGTCGLSGATQAARITGPAGCPPANASVLGVLRPGPLVVGSWFLLDFRTDPNLFVAVFASPRLATNALAALVVPEVYLDPNALLFGGVVPGNAVGSALISYTIPAMPALIGQSFWFQGVTGLALPLRTSAPVGGVIR